MFDILSRSNTTKLSRNDGYIDKNSFHIAEMAIIESYQQDINLLNSIISSKNSQMQFMESGIDEYKIHLLHEGTKDKIKTAILKMWNWLINKIREIKKAIINGFRKLTDNTDKMLDAYAADLERFADKIGTVPIEAYFKYSIRVRTNNNQIYFDELLKDYDDYLDLVYNNSDTSMDLPVFLNMAKDDSINNLSQKDLMYKVMKSIIPNEELVQIALGNKNDRAVIKSDVQFKPEAIKILKAYKNRIGKADNQLNKIVQNLEKSKKDFERKEIDDDKVLYNFNKVFSAVKQCILKTADFVEQTLYDHYNLLRKIVIEAIKKMKTLTEYKSKNESYLFDNSSFELYLY